MSTGSAHEVFHAPLVAHLAGGVPVVEFGQVAGQVFDADVVVGQQAPLVLTFDTGVIPIGAYEWAADHLNEFDQRLPAPENHVNHVPAMVKILRTNPEAPLIGVWGTSVTDNPFDPWDEEADEPGSGIPLSEIYVLERHRSLLAELTGESNGTR